MRTAIRPLLALVVTAAVGLSGCATPASAAEVQQFVSSIDQGMQGVSSYRGTVAMDIDGGSTSGSMAGTMEGTVAGGKPVNSHADIKLAVGSTRVGVEVLMIGSKAYVGGSTMLDAVPQASGKKWILADRSSSNSTVRKVSESIDSVSSNNLSGMLAFVEATRSFSKEGTATVNGVATTEYDVELDPSKIPNTAAGSVTADSIDATFFVDDQGRIRRVVIELAIEDASAELTMDVTDYDVDVDLQQPSTSTVYSG